MTTGRSRVARTADGSRISILGVGTEDRFRAMTRRGQSLALLVLWVFAALPALVWTPGAGTAIVQAVVGAAPQAGAYVYNSQTRPENSTGRELAQVPAAVHGHSGISAGHEAVLQPWNTAPTTPPRGSASVPSLYDDSTRLLRVTYVPAGPEIRSDRVLSPLQHPTDATKTETEVVQRWMSRAELDATRSTG